MVQSNSESTLEGLLAEDSPFSKIVKKHGENERSYGFMLGIFSMIFINILWYLIVCSK